MAIGSKELAPTELDGMDELRRALRVALEHGLRPQAGRASAHRPPGGAGR